MKTPSAYSVKQILIAIGTIAILLLTGFKSVIG